MYRERDSIKCIPGYNAVNIICCDRPSCTNKYPSTVSNLGRSITNAQFKSDNYFKY